MELSNILNVIGTAAVLIGIVFGLTQLRHYHLSRKRDSALFLLNSYQTGEFSSGIWNIMSLPDGLTKVEIEEKVGEDIKGIYQVLSAWESIGILVFQKEITMEMAGDAYRSPILISWKKLEMYVSGMREELQTVTIFEWFQWLAERMMERENEGSTVPAYIAHKEWTGKR